METSIIPDVVYKGLLAYCNWYSLKDVWTIQHLYEYIKVHAGNILIAFHKIIRVLMKSSSVVFIS